MIYALDTNIISYLLRGNTGVTQRWRWERTQGNPSVIPIIVYYEAKRGLISANAKNKLDAFKRICEALGVTCLTIGDVDTASRIYFECKKLGCPIEDTDLLIAAQALSRGYTLVTNNIKHFERIDGLQLVNWAE